MFKANKKIVFYGVMVTAMALATGTVPALAEAPEELTVARAVEAAIANNPAVVESGQYLKSAESSARSARAALLPRAEATYDYTGLKETPLLKTATGAFQAAHRHQYNWTVSVIQPLFTGFALTSRLQAARLETRIRELEKDQVLLDLTKDVRIACYHLLLAEKLLGVARDEVAALTAHNKDAGLFFDQGLIPKNDLLRSQVGLANALQQLERNRANLEKAVAQLNRLLVRPLTSEIRIAETSNTPEIEADYDRYARQAIENRPVMKSINLSLKAMGFQEKAVRSGLFPEIALHGGYMQDGDDWRAKDNDYANSHNAWVGVSATWTFWDWGKVRSDGAAVNQKARALEAKIRALADGIRQQVRNAGLDCRVARNNIATASSALAQARENWRITNVQYQQQVATSTDVLDARTFLTGADTNYYNAVYGYLSAVAELSRVTGKDITETF